MNADCSIFTPLFLFFFNDTATTEIYTLSLHDALPIYYFADIYGLQRAVKRERVRSMVEMFELEHLDRKSTRLNSSHSQISYAVFCLKKKKPHAMGILKERLKDDAPAKADPSYEYSMRT